MRDYTCIYVSQLEIKYQKEARDQEQPEKMKLVYL